MIDFNFQPQTDTEILNKRDVTQYFSYKFTSDLKMGSMLRNLLNPVFDIPHFERISGWIGQDDYIDNNYYYKISESTYDRNHYQLCPFVVSINESNEVDKAVHYVDIINGLKSQGALTGNVNRLLNSECKSWCPPVNPDKLVNFLQYVWSPLGSYIYEFKSETNLTDDLIGKKTATLLLETTHTEFDEETGSWVDVQDKLEIKTGMRIRVYNDKNSKFNNIVYLIDGVGREIKITDDRENGNIYEYPTFEEFPEKGSNENFEIYADLKTQQLYEWNSDDEIYELLDFKERYPERLIPDYVTIERNSEDLNDWSVSNRWFNFTLMNNNRQYYLLNSTRSKHQIIEFEENLKLYKHGTKVVDTVDCYFKGNPNVLLGKFAGATIPSEDPKIPNPTLRDGMKILIKDTQNRTSEETIYVVSGSQYGTSNLSKVEQEFKTNDEVIILGGSRAGLWYWKDRQFNKCLTKEDTEYPLFDLFDKDYVELDNLFTYPESSFKGSKLFGYKMVKNKPDYINFVSYMDYDLNDECGYFYDFGKNEYRTFLNKTSRGIKSNWVQYFYVTDENQLNYSLDIVPDNVLKVSVNTKDTEKYIINGPMISFYPPLSNDEKLLHENDIIKVTFEYDESVDEDLPNAYLEPTRLLSVLPENEKIKEIPYNVLLTQMIDIIEHQENFEGNPWSHNNYSSTAQDISLGSKIFVSYSRLDKLALINQMQGVDIVSIITKISEKYKEFTRRFLQRVDFISSRDTFTVEEANNEGKLVEIVEDILSFINMGKTKKDAFYNNGVISDTSYIPATPAFLGMVPCVKPVMTDTEIICHDGSRFERKFGDWRDMAQFMLEKMIYESINPEFKNSLGILKYNQYIPSSSRDTDYTYKEFIDITSSFFAKWFNENTNETFTNINYDINDPFTWNWSSCVDLQGEPLLGHYRGIYKNLYGTYRPDTCPWEMLGFYEEPDWWVEQYGEKPYTSNNLVMWQDIANGIIRQGKDAGTYEYLKMPNLLKIIPVDEEGLLLPPNLCGITQQTPIEIEARKPFSYGDGSDAEYDWWNTSDYQFALMASIYLMKPGFWLEYTWDTTSDKTLYELSESIHNLEVNGEFQKVTGSSQWISDFLSIRGIAIENLASLLKKKEIRLGYRVGSYLDYGNIHIKNVKNEVLLSTDYQIITYRSPIIRSISMSVMHIAWVDGKYVIYGNDSNEPWFRVMTPDIDANYTYDRSTALPITYFRNWYDNGDKIPYYTVVDTVQEVYNIIRGYGKYLMSQGFIYENYDTASQTVVNWDKMAKNFLQWCVSSVREDRDELALSPWNIINTDTKYPYSYVSFENDFGVIDNICSFTNNVWNVLDIYGNAILPKDIEVYRQENGVVITTKDVTQIGYLHLNIYSQENAIIFNTIQESGYKLYHSTNGEYISNLYIEGVRTSIWDGGFYAPGLILNDKQVIYNYTTRAYNIKDYYNIDSITAVEPLGIIAKSITGYTQNVLLNNIFTNEMAEFNFFNASKIDKGSFNVIKALRRLPDLQSINVIEIFALLIQEYGNIDNYKMVEFKPNSEWNTNNPQIFLMNTFKKYRETLNIVGQPVMSTDFVFITKKDDFIETKNKFQPYNFNWNIKIKVAIDEAIENKFIRPIIAGSEGKAPMLYVDNTDTTINLKIFDKVRAEHILKISDIYIGRIYDIEYGRRENEFYLKWTNDNKTWNEETYTLSSSDIDINDDKLYIGKESSGKYYWTEGRIILDGFENSLDNNMIKDKNRLVNNIYIDSEEWLSKTDFIEDNRFEYINEEYNGIFLPYIPLLRNDETQYKIYDESDLYDLIASNDITSTDRILVTFSNLKDWDLLQLKPTNRIVSIDFDEEVDRYGKEAAFRTEKPHNLVKGQIITIKTNHEETEAWENVQTVASIKDEYTFTILQAVQASYHFEENDRPELVEIISRKFDKKSEIDTQYVSEGDLFFVENDIVNGKSRHCLYEYHNKKLVEYRAEQPKINTSLIQQVLQYEEADPLKFTRYEIFDPYKFSIDLEAKKNIDYVNSNDPALYSINRILDKENTQGRWANEHVGEVWWDTSKCKYFDYEIDDNVYRNKMWGKMVLGSEIRVYEWIKSPVSPDEYSESVANKDEVDGIVLSGIPYSVRKNDTTVYQYNMKTEFDEQSKSNKIWYYFWVEMTQYLPHNSNRTLTTSSIVQRINSDVNNTKWFAPINCERNIDGSFTSAFIMANNDNLNDPNQIIQLKFKEEGNDYPLHRDWLYFHQSLENSKYLDYWNKFKDSISGYTEDWEVVPYVMLKDNERNGVMKHPLQTMYPDKKLAMKNIIQKINDMLYGINLDSNIIETFSRKNMPVVEVYEDYMFEEIKEDDKYFVYKVVKNPLLTDTNYQVLEGTYKKVDTENSSDTSNWKWVDAELTDYIDFSNTVIKQPKIICQTHADLEMALLEQDFNDGELIYVHSDIKQDGKWAVYKIVDQKPYLEVVQLYKMTDYFEYIDWYQPGIENFNIIKKTYKYVSQIKEDETLEPVKGTMIKVLNGDVGKWSILQYNGVDWQTVANEDGTIRITDSVLKIDTTDPLSDSSKLYALVVRNILRLFED